MKRRFRDRALAIAVSVVMVLSLFVGIDMGMGNNNVYATGLAVGSNGKLTPYTQYPANVGVTFATKSTKNIIEVGLTRNPDTYLQASNGILEIEKAYATKIMQNKDNSLFFVNDDLYNEFGRDGNFAIAYYNGSGSLDYYGSDTYLARIRQLGGVTNSGNIYYDRIKDMSDGELLSSWKDITSFSEYSNCLGVWNWILQINGSGTSYNYDIKNRIDKYTKSEGLNFNDLNSLSDADRAKVKYAYIDLLMTMYTLSMGSTANIYWETAINDYIEGTKLEESPVTIVIGDCVKMYLGKNVPTNSVITRVYDYIHYAAGIENAYRLDKPGYINIQSTDMLGKLKEQADLSKFASPTKKRPLDVNSAREPFSSGYSAVVSKRLNTSGYPTTWGNQNYTGVALDAIQFTANNKGFMLVPSVPTSSSDFKIKLTATIDGRNVKIISNRDNVGSPVKLTVSGENNSTDLAKWESILNSYNSYRVSFDFKRTDKNSNTTMSIRPNAGVYPLATVWDSNRLRLFLSGSESVVDYTDNSVINEAMSNKKMVQYEYNVTMRINYGPSYESESLAYSSSMADLGGAAGNIVTVLRQDDDKTFRYDSVPQSYAEIKEGVPRGESFEAMAGVPSTETLYFAAGGSEFIAQVELEYIEDEEATRTYNDVFHGTACEFKTGDVGKSGGSANVSVQLVSGGANGAPNSYGAHTTGTMTSPTLTGASGSSSSCTTKATWGGPGADPRTFKITVNRDPSLTWTVTETATWHDTTKTSNTHSCPGHTSGDPPKTSYDHCGCHSEWTQTGYYTYTLPAHIFCGPCCEHDLPAVRDTWVQKSTYDYVKIIDSHIWKIDKASVDGMNEVELNSTDLIKASIKKGDPNVFYNFAQDNTSRQGRLRYSVEPQQHDAVTWEEKNGSGQVNRTNKCNGLVSNKNGKTPAKGHGYAWATGILYNNTTFSNEYEYHKNSMPSLNTNTNSRADSVDAATYEYQRFNERRTTINVVDVISDVLILQTSSGDQSIMYFNKKSTPKQTQDNFDKIASTKQEMWDNNPNSAAKWSSDEINLGSYNGKFESTATKYNGTGKNNRLATSFDNDPASKNSSESRAVVASALNYKKPASTIGGQSISSPANLELRMDRTSDLLLYEANIKQKPTNPNKSYITGNAQVFWKSIIQYKNDDMAMYSTGLKSRYSLYGHVQSAPYSEKHTKVNDIIVHNPVSVSDAIVVGLDDDRDQRSSMPVGSAEQVQEDLNALDYCPGTASLCDFRVLNCTYFMESVLASFDFESEGNKVINSKTEKEYTLPSGFTIDKTGYFGTGNSLNAIGTRWSIPLSDLDLSYRSSVKLRVEADAYINNDKDTMLFSYDGYGFFIPKNAVKGGFNTGNGVERQADYDITNKKLKIRVDFGWSSTNDCKVYVQPVGESIVEVPSYTRLLDSNEVGADLIGSNLNIGSWGKNNSYAANFKLDNLVITRLPGTAEHTASCFKEVVVHSQRGTHVHTDACYAQEIEYGCNNLPLNSGGVGSKALNYTGAVQTFIAPATGTYTLEVWGAQGGNGGSLGGRAKGNVNLQAGDILRIYVGGQGGGGGAIGGWNGGGNQYNGYGSGGGATDIRLGGTELSHRIIVAGGGAGKSHTGIAYPGGGTTGLTGTLGQGQNATGHHGGGGGGGYYGGAGGSGCDSASYGGSNYVGGVTSTSVSSGVRSSNGYATITWDAPMTHTHTEDCISARPGDLDRCTGDLNTLSMLNAHLHTDACLSKINKIEQSVVPVNFAYSGGVQTFTAPYTGEYLLEVWGAQGEGPYGGMGGYSKGTITVDKGTQLRIYVGGRSGYNGGGAGGYSGGGGTDIRLGGTTLAKRIIVAGGGGGTGNRSTYGGSGGGITGGDGSGSYGGPGGGATQTRGGQPRSAASTGYNPGGVGTLGQGGAGAVSGTSLNAGGGGGGYYGGAGGSTDYPNYNDNDDYGGGGGSGYIGGVSNGWMVNAERAGNGQAKITFTGDVVVYTGILVDAIEKNLSGNETDLLNMVGSTVYELIKSMSDIDAIFDIIKENLGKIPNELPDGSWNPIFKCDRDYNIHICNEFCGTHNVLMCDEPHHNGLHYDGSNEICWDACFVDDAHKYYKPEVQTANGEHLPNGKFVNIDYEFQVYFPNVGDFEQGQKYGISKLTDMRGLGYVNRMDTSKWTREKRVKFDFNVLYNREGTWEQYNSGEWVELPVKGNTYPYYDFYCLLANDEVKATSVQYDVEAINCAPSPGGDSNYYLRDLSLDNDNTLQDNKTRTRKYTSKHGAYKDSVIDVVGRVGNLIVSDSGDYRFSNLFKVPKASEDWIVEGIVKKVMVGVQNQYMAWGGNDGTFGDDIRGKQVAKSSGWYNTWGYQTWLDHMYDEEGNIIRDRTPVLLPLSPDRNNIGILRTEPMRPGYDVFFELTTVGNYNNQLQITPYFYALNLKNNDITPVDVYIYTEGKYEPINLYDVVGSEDWAEIKKDIYPYTINLDWVKEAERRNYWVKEAERRNYSVDEKRITDELAQLYREIVKIPSSSVPGEWVDGPAKELNRPVGEHYQLGTAQLLTPNTKARTFIGNSETMSERFNGSTDTNFENKLPEHMYWEKAQRWHLKMGIPSSSVFVGYKNENRIDPTDIILNSAGKEMKAYEEYQNKDYAILMTMDIKAVGDTFVLQYDHGSDNGKVKIGDKTYTFGTEIPSLVAVYSANKSSIQDVDILKTH